MSSTGWSRDQRGAAWERRPARRRLDRWRRRRDGVAKRIYLGAFVARAAIGLLAYALTQVTDLLLFEDALWYEFMGYNVATDWLAGREGGLDALSTHGQMVWVMVATVAVLYYVMGGIRALPLLLVLYSAITALVPFYIYRIGRVVGMPESAARRGAWLAALSPAFVFWSGSLYKEGLILLALGAIVYHTLRLQVRWQAPSFAILLGAVGALFGLRFYLGALMTMVVAAGLLLVRRSGAARGGSVSNAAAVLRQVLVAAVFIGIVVGLGLSERAERRLTETPEGILLELDKTRQWLAVTAQSGYLPDAEVGTVSEAAEFFPLGLFYFLTVPLPWQTGGLRQNMIIPETAFWILLYPLIGIGLVRGLRVNRSGTLVIVAATAGMCVIYALLSGNVGIAYRMRSQVWLLWAPFAAWGWEIWRRRAAGKAAVVHAPHRRAALRSR